MIITKKEFKLLFRIKRKGYILISNDDAVIQLLLKKGLVDYAEFGIVAKDPEKFCLTNEGEYALEQNRYMINANFRSWAALVISIIALLISALNLVLPLLM